MRQGPFDLLIGEMDFRATDKVSYSWFGRLISNQILISFEEPWLFEQRLAFGVELFRTDLNTMAMTMMSCVPALVYLRRRLFELVETVPLSSGRGRNHGCGAR